MGRMQKAKVVVSNRTQLCRPNPIKEGTKTPCNDPGKLHHDNTSTAPTTSTAVGANRGVFLETRNVCPCRALFSSLVCLIHVPMMTLPYTSRT